MKLIIVQILVLLLISSCKKENEVDSLSDVQKLTVKKWKLTVMIYTNNGKTEDLFASSPKCKIDDVLVFTQNGNSEEGTFYFEEKELCSNQVIDTTKYVWKKSSKGIELFFIDNTGQNIGSIFLKRLTTTTLIFEVSDDSGSGSKYFLERTYSNQ